MYIEKVPNRGSRPAYLLRETKREGAKTVMRTLANLSKLSDETLETLRQSLRGVKLCEATKTFSVKSTIPCGHVKAIRRALSTLMYVEDDLPAARAERDPVAKAEPTPHQARIFTLLEAKSPVWNRLCAQ